MSGPMGLVYATPGDTSDTWGVVLNTLLNLVENHDHSSGKGVQIPSSGLGVDADVSWATNAITSLLAIEFAEVAATAVTSYSNALFANSADGNLYWRNASGVDVQITAGNTLDVSIVGGIGGDYSSVSALLSYNDASKNYWLQQEGGPRPWAGLQTGDIQLFQKAASITNAITLKSPNSLAASYAITLPAAVPTVQTMLQQSTSGALVQSSTLAANQNLGLSGTGYVQMGQVIERSMIMSASTAVTSTGSCSNANPGITINASSAIYIPLPGIPSFERIWQLTWVANTFSGTVTGQLFIPTNGAGWTAQGSSFALGTSGTFATGFSNGAVGPFWLKVVTASASGIILAFVNVFTDIP